MRSHLPATLLLSAFAAMALPARAATRPPKLVLLFIAEIHEHQRPAGEHHETKSP